MSPVDSELGAVHEQSPDAAPVASKPRRRTRSQRAVLIMGTAAAVGILLIVSGVVFVASKLGNIERDPVKVDPALLGGPMNIVVVGSDSRADISPSDSDAAAFLGGGDSPTGQRSDTIMIVRVDPQSDHVDLLSLPRDLWLPLAGSSDNSRINEAYSAGTQKLIDTIKQDFGIQINHYVEVNFKGFEGVVDAIGGVPMYFDKPMRDTNSGLLITNPGCQTLNGEQALGFARSRHLQYLDKKSGWTDDPSGDLGRIARQQFFIRTLFAHATKSALTPDLRVAANVLDATTRNLKVDQGFDVEGMAALGQKFASFSPDQIHTYSLPVTQYTTAGGASVVRMSADASEPILNLFRGLPTDAIPPASLKATVAGSGKVANATDASTALAAMGYDMVAPPTDGSVVAPTTPPKRTTIRYPEGSQGLALELARHLTAGADVVLDKNIFDFTLVVTIGADYRGTTTTARPLDQATALPTSTTVPTGAGAGAATKATTKGAASSSSVTTAPPSTEQILGGGPDATPIGVVPGKPPPGVTCG
jgi:LCP family protein required for cell wall assembly